MRPGAVTWLDFQPDELSRARDFLRSLEEAGVIDELGFLALLGRFSDLLHPATTTLMQSSRYFYFVAGIYRQLERTGTRSSQVPHQIRKRLNELADTLKKQGLKKVIGRDAGDKLKQLPSLIYWSGLKKLGMFTRPLSEAEYQDRFDEIRRERKGYADDDKVMQETEDSCHYWADDLPPITFLDKERVKPTTTFDLTLAEARDLRARYLDVFPDSLLSHMLRNRYFDMDWPWKCPRLSKELTVCVDHARNLSLFVRGATLQYYALLLEKRLLSGLGSEKASDLVRPKFVEWWKVARSSLQTWRARELLNLGDVGSALRTGRGSDLTFIDGWLERFRNNPTADALLRDEEARALIRDREREVKPGKARLRNPRHLEQWKPERIGDDIFQFDYRHRIGARFASEIIVSLEQGR